MTSRLVAIDPGRTTGFASFVDSVLVSAGTIAKADLFKTFTAPALPNPQPFFTTAVLIEHPRWYPHDHKDVNDLIDLAVLVGEAKRHYELLGASVELVWPRTWKGNAPKDVTNRRTVAALSETEVALLPRRPRAKDFDNNMLDAVGLGLWKLRRL